MSYKNLAVFADASAAGLARVKAALALAGQSGAHLEVQHLYPVWQAPIGIGAAVVQEAYAELLAKAQADAQGVLKAIEALHKPGADFSVHAQSSAHFPLSEAAANAARRCDLAFVALPEQDTEREIVEGVLFDGGAPALVLPQWIEPQPWGRRALIAWKSSGPSARAVRAALPILSKAQSTRILVVDPRGDAAAESEDAMQRLAAAIGRHGVKVEAPVLIKSSLDDVVKAIEGEAEEFGADLMVMGAYAHSRATEWIFGGVTRHMLKQARLPLLLSH